MQEQEPAIPDCVQRVRAALDAFLRRRDWSLEEFADLLEGYGLPVQSGDGDEPYLWLLRALPLDGQRQKTELKLAKRLARLLHAQPELRDLAHRQQDLLYNALMLAAGLRCPEALAGPLFEIYSTPARLAGLSGQYLGIPLQAVLRDALMENQLDSRLESEWLAMVADDGTARLPGDPERGLWGLRNTLVEGARPAQPDLEALGYGLRLIADRYRDRPDRRESFRALVANTCQAVFNVAQPDLEMLLVAHRQSWPAWATECLPRLFFWTGNDEAILWHYAFALLPSQAAVECLEVLCDGQAVRVHVPSEARALVETIAQVLEATRSSNPFASDHSTEASLKHTVADLVDVLHSGELKLQGLIAAARSSVERWPAREPDPEALEKSILLLARSLETLGQEATFALQLLVGKELLQEDFPGGVLEELQLVRGLDPANLAALEHALAA
ncbi:MAG: hypothetical protein U0002_11575 [Thermoanaerobaculia bacterium]